MKKKEKEEKRRRSLLFLKFEALSSLFLSFLQSWSSNGHSFQILEGLSLSLVYLYNLTLSVSCLLTFLTSLFVDITVNAIQQISSNFIKFSNQLFNCSWPYFYCLLAEILIRPYTLYYEEFRNR
jgi:hypothetical protein